MSNQFRRFPQVSSITNYASSRPLPQGFGASVLIMPGDLGERAEGQVKEHRAAGTQAVARLIFFTFWLFFYFSFFLGVSQTAAKIKKK